MSNKKAAFLSGSFNFGAGSIRAYPHAENTGLVISDIAKVQQILFLAKVLWKIFHFHIITSPLNYSNSLRLSHFPNHNN